MKEKKTQLKEISDSRQSDICNQDVSHVFSEVIVPSSRNAAKMTAADDEYLRGLSIILLRQMDYKVIVSSDGRKPLNILEKNRSRQDSLLAGLTSHFFSGSQLPLYSR